MSLRNIYLPAFALYGNLAVDTMKSLIKQYNIKPDNEFLPKKDLESLCNDINNPAKQEEISHYVDKFKSIYPFVKHILRPDDTDTNCLQKIYLWVNMLVGIRNQYSHSVHKPRNIDKNILKELQSLYNKAVESSYLTHSEIMPDRYQKIYVQKAEGVYFLTYTGIIFYISLFLRKQEVGAFLGELMQMAILRDDSNGQTIITQRQQFKKKHPEAQYPDHLRVKNKDFLYRNDVYTYFAVRGHVVPITNKENIDKIHFFKLMNYLQQCPQERLLMEYKDNIPTEQQTEKCIPKEKQEGMPPQVDINGTVYTLREKNNFIRYALDYWEEQFSNAFPNGTEWKWARCASGEQKQNKKREKGFDKLTFHETIVWDKPQGEESYSEDGFEITFPYYTEANNVFFRLKNGDNYIVGMMSSKVLYDLLRNYFVDNDRSAYIHNIFNHTWEYMNQYLNYTAAYKAQNPNLAIPAKYARQEAEDIIAEEGFHPAINAVNRFSWSIKKEADNTVLENKIRTRIHYLKHYYEQLRRKSTSHQKMLETVRAWFSILNYGATTNWTHALTDDGLISQYRWITYYLSRLATHDTVLAEEFDHYLSRSGLKKLLQEKQSDILTRCYDLNDYFDHAICYRLQMLSTYEEWLEAPFESNKWQANEALRWLKIRTPERAMEYPKRSAILTKKTKLPIDPPVLNMEKGVYFAARAISLAHNFYTKISDLPPQEYTPRIDLASDFYSVNMKLFKAGHFRRLYAIKQQDTVLTHIAAYYAQKHGLTIEQTLQSTGEDYQSMELVIPNSTTVSVCYYYRYFKQANYRLPSKLLEGLLEAAVKLNKIPTGGRICFNGMKPEKDQNGKIVFIKKATSDLTLWDLWKTYSSSRLRFIDDLLKLEKQLYTRYEHHFLPDRHYVPFREYVTLTKREDKSPLDDIHKMRKAALHGYVYLPMVRLQGEDIDFFGQGTEQIKKLRKILEVVEAHHRRVSL